MCYAQQILEEEGSKLDAWLRQDRDFIIDELNGYAALCRQGANLLEVSSDMKKVPPQMT